MPANVENRADKNTTAGHKAKFASSKWIGVCMTFGVGCVFLNNQVPIQFISFELLLTLCLFASMRYGVSRFADRLKAAQWLVVPLIALLPFVIESISRKMFAVGLPLEATILCTIRNFTLLPFVFPKERRCHVTSAGLSLLLVFAIYIQDDSISTSVVVFGYCVLGMCWLIGWHWSRLHLKAPSASQREIPRAAKIGIVGATTVGATVAMLSFQATGTTSAIAGFMPSSGGDQSSGPFAFGGVGDGDQLVEATESAKSIGAIESELFLESKTPSVYDVFNELYQEPNIRKNKRSRAIPLAPNDVTLNHDRLAKNEAASREFSATRKKGKREKKRDLKDVRTAALFYVKGRVPLHLKHQIYNTWDGTTLSFVNKAEVPDLSLVLIEEKPWLDCGVKSKGDFGEAHTIRFARLRSDRVPSPANLCAATLDRLHSAKFFQWTTDGVLALAGGDIPSMTVLHVRSNVPHREVVEAMRFESDEVPSESNLHPTVLQKLRTWTESATSDWEKLQAVVSGIQATCQLDSDTSIDKTQSDVVNDFLLEKQRGPDYLFAITAARLIRELGFRSHVVSGFYADPKNYDRASGQTAIYPENVHFWIEVQAADKSWITVEPSPGYEILYAREPWYSQLVDSAHAAVTYVWGHRFKVAFVTVILSLMIFFRQRIHAYRLQLCWHLHLPRSERAVVRSFLPVLEAHAHIQGRPRRSEITVESWLRATFENPKNSNRFIADEFRRLIQWALYSTQDQIPTSKKPRQVCREVLSHYVGLSRSSKQTSTQKKKHE